MHCGTRGWWGVIKGLVSFVIPSVRADGLRRTLESTNKNAGDCLVEMIVVTESGECADTALTVPLSSGRYVAVDYQPQLERGCIEAWNSGLALSQGEYICFWSDDVVPHEGFLQNTLPLFKYFADGNGYVGFNDLQNDPNVLTTFYIATRRYVIDYQGGVLAYPCYRGLFNDTESMERAKNAGRFRYAENAIAEHMHPSNGKREKDEWDERMSDTWEHDYEVFKDRKKRGFPDEWEKVITE